MEKMALMIPIIALMIPLFVVVSRSDIGQAIADAIRHNSGANKVAAARREFEGLLSQCNDAARFPMEKTPV